jgi:hypothetical protein
MKNCFKKLFYYLGLVIVCCAISISGQFIHELSIKDWILHIIFGILLASGFLFFDKKNKKNQLNRKDKSSSDLNS